MAEPKVLHTPLVIVANSRVKTLVSIPTPASVKSVFEPENVVLVYEVVPPAEPPVPLTVKEPAAAGAVVSERKVRAVETEFVETSDPVIVWLAGLAAPTVQLYALEVKVVGLVPTPAVTVSAPCVQPVVPTAGKAAEAGPEPASVTASTTANVPTRSER